MLTSFAISKNLEGSQLKFCGVHEEAVAEYASIVATALAAVVVLASETKCRYGTGKHKRADALTSREGV